MRLFLHRFPALQLLALLWTAMAGGSTVHAVTLTVTSTADSGAGSLRAAMAEAGDGDTIQFDTTLNGQAIGLTGAELVIDKNITITGPGPNLLAVSRSSGAARIFHVVSGHVVTIAPKNVAVRGIGPSLTAFGISDALADPTLELRDSSGALLFQNDNWQDDPASAGQLIVLGLALQDPNESGIMATLQPGAYTAIVAGKNGGTGLGLVELYDTDRAASSQLANISTRGFVQTGDNVMIGGFILGGGN